MLWSGWPARRAVVTCVCAPAAPTSRSFWNPSPWLGSKPWLWSWPGSTRDDGVAKLAAGARVVPWRTAVITRCSGAGNDPLKRLPTQGPAW